MFTPRFHPYAPSAARAQTRGTVGTWTSAVRGTPTALPVARGISTLRRPGVPAVVSPRGISTLPRPGFPAAGSPTVTLKPVPTITTTSASAATLASAPVVAVNAKAKLNEWMTKVGHHVPYVTVPCQGGFQATLVLPLEGAGDAANCVGVATTKKMAEQNAADQAMQTLMNFGLLDVLNAPSKRSQKMTPVARAPAAPGTPEAIVAAGATADFENLKQHVLQLVQSQPGKRTTVYMMMCPAGERRKRVSAALYKLAEQGLIMKHEPSGGKNLTPFWAPIGYEGPMGGGVSEDSLGEGRTLPLTEVKMVCYDVMAQTPNLTAHEINAQTRAIGHPWDTKMINAALYSMERDGTAESVLDTSAGTAKRWHVKA